MAQPLFANQRETNLHSTVAVVEEVLAQLGHPPADSRVDPDRYARSEYPTPLHAWRIQKGSADSHVTLIPRVEFTHLRVVADVMTIDPKVDRIELFQHLLE